jgi:ATP synthase subunit 6
MNFQPLEQFEIIVFQPFLFKLLNQQGSAFFGSEAFFFTNSVLYTVFTILSIFFFFYISIFERTIFSENPWEIFLEDFYNFIFSTMNDQLGDGEDPMEYFGLVFALFLFILFSNLLGLTPFGFTTTSFIIKTFFLSCGLLIGLTLVGILIQGKNFLHLFIPSGVPQALVPMLVFIEVVSYISRAFSLAIRLFANMMSGHSLLNILSGFCVSLSSKSIFLGIIPFLIILAISFLEVGIAILQAYVFIVLLCIYMNDVIFGHGGDTHEQLDTIVTDNIFQDSSTFQKKIENFKMFTTDLRKYNVLPEEAIVRSTDEVFFDIENTVNVFKLNK